MDQFVVDPELVETPSRCLLVILFQAREVLTQGVNVYGVSVQLLETAEFAGELQPRWSGISVAPQS